MEPYDYIKDDLAGYPFNAKYTVANEIEIIMVELPDTELVAMAEHLVDGGVL